MNVGLLGAGRIARAFAEGWSGLPDDVPGGRPALLVYDIDSRRAADVARTSGARHARSAVELVGASDLVVLAVKPKDVRAALQEVRSALGRRPLVSLAVYWSTAQLGELLPEGSRVGRVMPNVAVAVRRGVLLFASGSLGADAQRVRDLFAAVGQVVPLDERLFDVGTAVSACGPAFLALMVEALEEGALAAGLDSATARSLACATAAGSGALIAANGDPRIVREAVTSPGGMTAAGIDVMETRGLRAAVAAAVEAAVRRGRELA